MISISDLTFRLGHRLLLDQASASLPAGARAGLVGRNGSGKTTLFRIIAEELSPESGLISLPRNARMGRVEQEAPGGPMSLIDFVLAADLERVKLLAEAETAMEPGRIADIQTRLADIGAHAAPARAAAILHGLGFDTAAQHRPCADFSGGWRMRVALAAVLFSEPDLLLLDEPTNYLDIEGALWLQDYLGRYPHTMLIISHDRDFLDASVDHILHLGRGKLTLYRGGWSQFDRQRREKAVLQSKLADRQIAERQRIQAFIDRFRAKASKARQAQSRIKRLEKMEPIAVSGAEEGVEIIIPSPKRPLAPPLIRLEDASCGYDGRTVLKRLNLSIAEDDRIGLLGSNGNGKSTLVKLICGRLQPMSGEIRSHKKMRVAYFAQHQLDELPLQATPASLVRALLPEAPESQVRARAHQLGFGAAKSDTTVEKLSGGEKARLLLGLAAFEGPHILVLDEPTNHLDIEARAALVEALTDYSGAVIIVSHDRFLIEAVCDQLWLVADQGVKTFDGDIEDYAKFVLSGGKPAQAGRAAELKPETAAPPRVSRVKIEKRAADLEAEITKLENLIARVDAALADPENFRADPLKAGRLAGDRAALAEKLAAAEDLWLEASGK